MDIIFISWETHRRNQSLSREIGAKLFELNFDHYPKIFRYIISTIHTIKIINRERPKILFTQNPSFILSLLALLIKLSKCYKYKLFIDCHNSGVYLLNGKYRFINMLNHFLLSTSDYVIVSNDFLSRKIKMLGGNPITIEDPLPIFNRVTVPHQLNGKFNILFISSFSDDEPYIEAIDAGNIIDKNIHIYMTGKPSEAFLKTSLKLPNNMTLTGYLSNSDYVELLFSVDAVMDLTKRENCLLCGAYEAVAAKKPLILSKKKVLMDYFNIGAVYANNTSTEIANAIKSLIQDYGKYNKEASSLNLSLLKKWEKRRNSLLNIFKLCNVSCIIFFPYYDTFLFVFLNF